MEKTDLTPLNKARIALVPKITLPQTVADYRPISVINLIPKLISKLLANRIKIHMADLIDKHQTAFVQGRYIAENFLSVREAMHHVHSSKSPALLLKIDFKKAFDTLDWPFLMNVMATRGFPEKFRRWVFHLLATSSSTIAINGQHSAPFMHKRGLRQGDPLSPYLFILAADVLQKMTASLSSLLPHQLTPKLTCPILTFQYADDTIFLLSAKGPTIRSLLLVIHCFSASSGLQVNFTKSAFVPFAITDDCLQTIRTLLGCPAHNLPLLYLGMPLTLRAPKREDFMPLVQKLEKRLEGWRARFLSRGGRLQLVKSVLSAVPTYYMSCFKLPKWLIDRIDAIRRNFLWSKSQPSAAIHLLNWRSVCLPIPCGGLGVPDLYLQNISMLLRWWWNLFANDHRLWKTYASSLYALPGLATGPLVLLKKGSFFWNSISSLRPLFHSCSQFQIVSGRNISFWFDGWDGLPLAFDQMGQINRKTISLSEARYCTGELFEAPFTRRQHLSLQKLNGLIPTNGSDRLLWTISHSQSFTVKSAYKVLSEGGKVRSRLNKLWKTRVTPSIKCFFFLLLNNRILTQDSMQRRNIPFTAGCALCPGSQQCPLETALHLFFHCPFASRIWMYLSLTQGYSLVTLADSVMNTYLASVPTAKNYREKWGSLFITTTWMIWKERNERVFRQHSSPVSVIVQKILLQTDLFLRHC